MTTPDLFGDTFVDALDQALRAFRSSKDAAAYVWPTSDPTAKAKHLLAALDDSRRESLSPAEIARLIQGAAERGCLTPLAYLARLCGCREPEPVAPEVEEGEATRALLEATQAVNAAVAALERARERSEKVRALR